MDLESLIAEALPSMPPGTRVVNVGDLWDDMVRLDARTDYAEELRPPDVLPQCAGGAPVLHTPMSFDVVSEEDMRRGLERLAERHSAEWAFIHSPEYAAGLAKARAAA